MVTRKDELEARFGASARAYAESPSHRGGPDLDLIIELAAPTGNEILLDIATGAGNTALAFAPRVARVVALDLAEGMIAETRERFAAAGFANADFHVDDVESLPFEDDVFDLVTCRIAPHHFLDVHRATREVARVLKPGGRYLLVDSMAPDDPVAAAFLHEVESLRDPTHVRSYGRLGWIGICEDAGLHVEHVEVVRKTHDFEAWVARGGARDDVQAEVRRRFATAPPPAREALAIVADGDAVASFSDDKIVLAARA